MCISAKILTYVFDLQVSWIRHHDLHILTVGRYTYTADLRYHSIYNGARDEWTLQIEYVQKRDAGRYECQINTQPVRSFFVQLKVAGICILEVENFTVTLDCDSQSLILRFMPLLVHVKGSTLSCGEYPNALSLLSGLGTIHNFHMHKPQCV